MNIILNVTERKPLADLLGKYKNTKPKYLRALGFIGDEYKTDRKILIRMLPGNSAFKGGEGHAISE